VRLAAPVRNIRAPHQYASYQILHVFRIWQQQLSKLRRVSFRDSGIRIDNGRDAAAKRFLYIQPERLVPHRTYKQVSRRQKVANTLCEPENLDAITKGRSRNFRTPARKSSTGTRNDQVAVPFGQTTQALPGSPQGVKAFIGVIT
jgi:hypothetical protein